jgi:hypothetical protein
MEKESLYRKRNRPSLSTKYYEKSRLKYRYERAKHNREERSTIPIKRRGVNPFECCAYNYNPLFKFLHSKVGSKWDEVYSECCSRLNYRQPIWWIIDKVKKEKRKVRVGENTYVDNLYIENGILCKYCEGD